VKAKTLQLARLKLNAQQISPVFIKEKSIIPFFSGGGQISSTTVLFFTRQLSFLLQSGISLVQALGMCVSTTASPAFKEALKQIVRQLEGGQSLSKCLRSRPDVFDGFYVNMIVCAEETGLLDQVLKDLANYMEKAEMIKSRVKSAMMYPAVVLIISLLIILGIIIFVVPQFAALYAGKGGLPALTQAFVSLSDLLRGNPLPFIGALIGIPLFIYQYSKMEHGKQVIQQTVRVLPLFGKIQFQAGMVRFFRSFHSLLRSGVNFLEALDVAYNIADHPNVQRGIKMSREYVTKGKSFAKGLENSKVFPPLVFQMTKIGEESGKMEQTFENLTNYYEEILDNLISGLIKMIEPLLLVFLGGIVGTIVLALYLPVFQMGELVN
ncbi:MAG: type II secretion system F family protein, partial [Oligoflexia bacterium]|nr:type II secretion system F family protein [Oligoflexia bacterium]